MPRKTIRKIDRSVDQSYDEFQSRFALVTKARANIWLTATIVLFVIGFLAGIVYLADPNAFLQGSISSSQSGAAFLRGTSSLTLNAPTDTANDNPTDDTDDNTNGQTFTPTYTVTPTAGRYAGNTTTSVVTRFNLNWNCNLPNNQGEGRVDKKVRNLTSNVSIAKIGTTYTEITTTVNTPIEGSWIALACTPPGGQTVTLRCDVNPATTVGQLGTVNCRNSSGGITGCTRNLAQVEILNDPTKPFSIGNGATLTVDVKVTNKDTTQCGRAAFVMSHVPNDGTSNLWNFKTYTPFAAILNPGEATTFHVPVSPWDRAPAAVPYRFSVSHSLTTSTRSEYLSCQLINSAMRTLTVLEGNRKQGTRDITGVNAPGCSNNASDALNSDGGYYTGPDDGSNDDTNAPETTTTTTTTQTSSWRCSGVWQTIYRRLHGGASDPRCQ